MRHCLFLFMVILLSLLFVLLLLLLLPIITTVSIVFIVIDIGVSIAIVLFCFHRIEKIASCSIIVYFICLSKYKNTFYEICEELDVTRNSK